MYISLAMFRSIQSWSVVNWASVNLRAVLQQVIVEIFEPSASGIQSLGSAVLCVAKYERVKSNKPSR